MHHRNFVGCFSLLMQMNWDGAISMNFCWLISSTEPERVPSFYMHVHLSLFWSNCVQEHSIQWYIHAMCTVCLEFEGYEQASSIFAPQKCTFPENNWLLRRLKHIQMPLCLWVLLDITVCSCHLCVEALCIAMLGIRISTPSVRMWWMWRSKQIWTLLIWMTCFPLVSVIHSMFVFCIFYNKSLCSRIMGRAWRVLTIVPLLVFKLMWNFWGSRISHISNEWQ